jgi:phage terminase large subunit-like protein
MLLDTNGDAVFGYTPPSFRTASASKAHDPRYASKLYAQAAKDTTGRWAAFTFTSHDNPHLSSTALEDITGDMTALAYKQEILAEDIENVPGALWTQQLIDEHRVTEVPEFTRVVIGIDPGHNAGIVAAARGVDGKAYILEDCSITGDPDTWARQSVSAYHKHHADALVPERNHGGDMVATTILHVDKRVHVKTVWASHGKYARAEPVSVLYAKHTVFHVGQFGELESQMCGWVPDAGHPSPDRLDALVWALTELMLTDKGPAKMLELSF